MEWNELSEADRRLLQQQLGLDENGFATTTPVSQKSKEERRELSIDSITQSEILRGCSTEVLKAAPYWSRVRQICARHRRVAHVDESKSSFRLVSAIPATVFSQFAIVWVESSLEVSWKVKEVISTERMQFESLHFVDVKKVPGGDAAGCSFELQSVQLKGRPLQLQCVAGTMVHFALVLAYWCQTRRRNPSGDIISNNVLALTEDRNAQTAKRPRDDNQPSTTDAAAMLNHANGIRIDDQPPRRHLNLEDGRPVLVLGMGGNIMCMCLARLFPRLPIHVVELEPAVYATCLMCGALPTSQHITYHLMDVVASLSHLPADASIIFLDCFDPLVGKMMHAEDLLRKIFPLLSPQFGMLVVNVHGNPTAETLAPFVRVFGGSAVQVIDIAGCVQCIVCCIRSPGNTLAEDVAETSAQEFKQLNVRLWNQLVSELNEQFQQAAACKRSQNKDDKQQDDDVFKIDEGLVKSSTLPMICPPLYARVWTSTPL